MKHSHPSTLNKDQIFHKTLQKNLGKIENSYKKYRNMYKLEYPLWLFKYYPKVTMLTGTLELRGGSNFRRGNVFVRNSRGQMGPVRILALMSHGDFTFSV